jgi:hypothetical protein
MLRVTCTVSANDVTAERFVFAATCVGIEGCDWVREWRDGGRLAFCFRDDTAMRTFQGLYQLLS